METITSNVVLTKPRRAFLNNREYIIADSTIIVEGVLAGSAGALYYPADELANNISAWDGMPLLLNHPIKDGQHISGRNPEVWGKSHLGTWFNTRLDGNALRGEAWFDLQNVRINAPSLLKRLQAGQPIELSTGLHTRNEPRQGTFNGKPFEAVARDYKPDHIAILPDAQGACSVKDGCGVLVNEERKSIWRKLGELLGVINADLPTPTEEQKRLGADCAKQKAMGHNPPSWAVDEALWEKAKEAAAKSGHEEDWPYIVAIYEQMGGKIEGAPTANMGPNEPSHDDLREQLESLIKERFGGLMKAGMPGMSMMGGGMMGGEEEHDCIEAVYDKEVVFEMGDKYWSIAYTTDLRTGAVTLDSGPPTEVNRVTTYKPVTNADSAAEDETDNSRMSDYADCKDECGDDPDCMETCMEGMSMNEKEREAIITHLATNCDCWKGDKEGLAKLSDQRLAALKQHSDSQTANTIPQSFEDGDRVFTFNVTSKIWEGKAKEKPVLPDPAIRLTAEEREDLAFARQERTRQKQDMVDRLTANIADENAKRAAIAVYASMKPEQLQPLLNALPPTPVQQTHYPSYLGAAGGGLAANAKDDSNNILPEISINFEEMASPKLRRKQA